MLENTNYKPSATQTQRTVDIYGIRGLAREAFLHLHLSFPFNLGDWAGATVRTTIEIDGTGA